MKKFLAMILALVMALSLVACGSKDNDQQQGGDVSGDKVIKVGVFEPTSGQNAGGGKKNGKNTQFPFHKRSVPWILDLRICPNLCCSIGIPRLSPTT